MRKRSREHSSDEFGKQGSGIAGLDAPMIGAAGAIFSDALTERESGVTPGPPPISVKALAIGLAAMFLVGVVGVSIAVASGLAPRLWPPFTVVRHAAPASASVLAVVIVNSTAATLTPASLETIDGYPLGEVSAVSPGSSVTVRPRLRPDLTYSIVLVSPAGMRYALVNTVDGNPGGRVTVRVTGKRAGVLTGEVIDSSGDRLGWRKSLEPLGR